MGSNIFSWEKNVIVKVQIERDTVVPVGEEDFPSALLSSSGRPCN